MRKILASIVLIGILSSCESEFLDKDPSVNTALAVETVEHLESLFNGIYWYYYNQEYVNTFCTDNTEIPADFYTETKGWWQPYHLDQYTWAKEINQNSDPAWAYHYDIIWKANLAITMITNNQVTGEDLLKKAILAEAYYRRANSLFELATIYALYPSAANADEPGLVLRKEINFEESQKRASLKETFDQIESDLEKALLNPLTERIVNRGTLPVIEAFAAKFYLYIGQYDKAAAHANEALSYHSEMINYSTDMYTYVSGGLTYPRTTSVAPYSTTALSFWKDRYIFTTAYNTTSNTSPSQELIDMYDPADLRRAHFVSGYAKYYGAVNNLWYTYFHTSYGYTVVGESVAEMYLIRAEAKARGGDLSGAMADVEMVRQYRFHPADYQALPVPATDKATVGVIVDERRREFPFTRRWMDLKRLNNDPLTDPIVVTREFYEVGDNSSVGSQVVTQTLEPNDRRYARPIGKDIILNSNGVTEQNTY